jgi:hypothetical protein
VERLKVLSTINKLASDLKRAKDVAGQPEAVKYLTNVISAAEGDRKYVQEYQEDAAKTAATEKAAVEKAAEAQLKVDRKMLEIVESIGYNDGLNRKSSRSRLFAKAPQLQKQYEKGYEFGKGVAQRISERPATPQTSMGPISKEDEERAKEYTRRKQARKEFIQYLNDQWGFVLPEDM